MAKEAIHEKPGVQAGKSSKTDIWLIILLGGITLFFCVQAVNYIITAENHLNEAVREVAKRDAALALSLSQLFPEHAAEIIRAFEVDLLAQCHQAAQPPGAMESAR